MDISAFATKGNLIKAKSDLSLAEMGYDLMDKKRRILIAEMMSLISRAEEIQAMIDDVFSAAYSELQRANVFLGINQVERIGYAIPEDDSLNIRFRSVMGVEIPAVAHDSQASFEYSYAFSGSNYFLDQAFLHFNKVKELTVAMAEVESAVYLLAANVKKTQKRANALQRVMIPRLAELVAGITNTLEEKDREEMSRLHAIKKMKQSKGAAGHGSGQSSGQVAGQAFLPSAGRW
jgi:V/A-type H+-transporting ATPase subunit D